MHSRFEELSESIKCFAPQARRMTPHFRIPAVTFTNQNASERADVHSWSTCVCCILMYLVYL